MDAIAVGNSFLEFFKNSNLAVIDCVKKSGVADFDSWIGDDVKLLWEWKKKKRPWLECMTGRFSILGSLTKC